MILGIDGGGTSTKLELRNDRNELIGRRQYGAFNITAIGEDAFRSLLREIAADVDIAQVHSLCAGGAGVSYGGLEQIIRDELGGKGFSGALRLCADFEIALRGAMDEPGCILIAGTGSVGFGVNAQGKQARVGGYGHLIDDGGSGYALGRDALAAVIRTLDGRMDAHALTAAVMSSLALKDQADVVRYVYRSAEGKANVARVAETVLDCAAAGDACSMEILRRNAGELKQIVAALAAALGMEKPRLSLLGGLLTHESAYRDLASAALSEVADVQPPQHDALWGAAQIAWEMGKYEEM